jgi:dTDP-4-dehydrorhamnose 3,5-epimerase-like enzyme
VILVKTYHPVHRDERGYVAELLRGSEGAAGEFGQLLVTVANPGVEKGNHYHTRKREWFCCLSGAVELVARDRATGEIERVTLTPDENGRTLTAEVPPNVTHAIINNGDVPACVLLYVTEEYDEADSDTFPELVLPPD